MKFFDDAYNDEDIGDIRRLFFLNQKRRMRVLQAEVITTQNI